MQNRHFALPPARHYSTGATANREFRDCRYASDAAVPSSEPDIRIAAFVQPRLHPLLERAVASEDTLFRAESWSNLKTIALQQRVDIAILDPEVGHRDDLQQVTGFSGQFPDLPILIYTPIGPSAARSIIALSNASIRHVVLHPFEGTPEELRKEMTHAIHDTLVSHFMERVTESIDMLPVTLRRGVQKMFAKPEQFRSVSDLALLAEVTPLRMYRQFQLVGLSSPKKLLITARLLRFYGHMKYAGLNANAAARRLGYPDCRVLARYSEKSLGIPLSKFPYVAEARVLAELSKMVVAP